MQFFGNLLGALWDPLEALGESLRLPWNILPPFGKLSESFGSLLGVVAAALGPLGVFCGAVAAALTPFGSLLAPLGKPSELPWAPSDAGGRVVGPHQIFNQNRQIS